MVKEITRDPMFLAQKSVDATEADKQVITDLLDTLEKFRSLRRDGGEHDRSEQKYYCSGSRTISVCNDQSGDHKENRGFSDGGRLAFRWMEEDHARDTKKLK